MFRNYAITALRNLARNPLYAAINVIGLAVGFAAALALGLFVRDEFSFDTSIPGYQRIYMIREIVAVKGAKPLNIDDTPPEIAAWLRTGVPAVAAIARLAFDTTSLRVGETEATENIWWADAGFLNVINLPVIAGDPATALARPDSVVLTRKMARKYFGTDAPIGKTIEFGRQHLMTVTAVLEDLPSNTSLKIDVLASGVSAASYLTRLDNASSSLESGSNEADVLTFFRARPDSTAAALARGIQAVIDTHVGPNPTMKLTFPLLRLDDVHFNAAREGLGTGDRQTTIAVLITAVLILIVACINFVNLTTARASRRAVEVGVRKVSGAVRRQLMAQFLGESCLFVGLALVLGIALAAALLPALNGFLDRSLTIAWTDPRSVAVVVAVAPVVAILAGAYPAFVLSAFKPAAVLKIDLLRQGGRAILRHLLVVMQFAVLIGLILASITLVRQTDFATNAGLRFDKDQVLVVETNCQSAFKDAVKSISGVLHAACSSAIPSHPTGNQNSVFRPDGTNVLLWYSSVDFGYFELYGIAPLAGRLFSRDFGGDVLTLGEERKMSGPYIFARADDEAIVLNQTAVRKFGFASPAAAIGQAIACNHMVSQQPPKITAGHPCRIIGVVPDFVEISVREQIPPAAYFALPSFAQFESIKLRGDHMPETLAAIDRLWKETGEAKPITRYFVDERVQQTYIAITRQAELFRIAAAVAIFIAGLGLFGLAAFTAETRTKEIGIRKAMGASRADILRLLLWQFTKPVLWANLIAWPVAGYLMHRWLEGFAYHVDLDPLIFVGASAVALVIAVLTVAGHALLVARAKPVTALRYE